MDVLRRLYAELEKGLEESRKPAFNDITQFIDGVVDRQLRELSNGMQALFTGLSNDHEVHKISTLICNMRFINVFKLEVAVMYLNNILSLSILYCRHIYIDSFSPIYNIFSYINCSTTRARNICSIKLHNYK